MSAHDPGPAPPALYWAQVMHARAIPFRHRFVYRLFTLLLDVDRLGETAGRLRFLSYNRLNLFSVHDRDHGACDGTPLRNWVERTAADAGAPFGGGPVRLLAFPRVLGYVFNPISVYFCHRPDGTLATVIYEVHNTFGGRHAYVARAEGEPGALLRHSADKVFYVSPFIGMTARYAFRLRAPGRSLALGIDQATPEGHLLTATLTGTRAPLSDGALLRAALRFPLMTLGVIGRIHWQALRLWWKGARYHPDAPPPPAPATRAFSSDPAQ